MLDMDRRLRPVRQRTFLVFAGALVLAGPWAGWWRLVPLVLAGTLFRAAEARIDRVSHPEYWTFAAWIATELIVALRIAGVFTESLRFENRTVEEFFPELWLAYCVCRED